MATPVDVMHIAGETAYISKGLSTGDIVVVTRLVNPLNNSLLNLMLDTDDPSSVDASL